MFLEEHPFLEGGDLVLCELDDHLFSLSIHSAKYQFFYSSFLQIILALNGCIVRGMELNQFRPPTSSNDLCLTFCLILILWI